jgi:hypothetical protein
LVQIVSTNQQKPSSRLPAYLVLVALGMVAGLVVGQRVHGIFGCPAGSYEPGRYIAYCGLEGFGDYDHGAFWFDLEPEAIAAARKAEVLFLGNSRLQLGISSRATDEWFASRKHSYYLLGFAYEEKMAFATEILGKLKPAPKAVVINVDKFFRDELSEPADYALNDHGARGRYRTKQMLQKLHRRLCGGMPGLCGDAYAFYRDIRTGAFMREGGLIAPSATNTESKLDEALLRKQVALATSFVQKLGVPASCVILTVVPFEKTPMDEVRALASATNLNLIAPDPMGFHTSDGGHLDIDSAERWSAAFLRLADPVLTQCLAGETASS